MKKMKVAALMAVAAMALSTTAFAAMSGGSIAITADNLTYDGVSGKAEASGSVVITQDDKTMTGDKGWYNTKTREADLSGGITMIGNDMSMAASSIHSYDDERFTATGSVHLERGGRQIFGDSVDYNTKTEYGTVDGNARLIANGKTLTANHVEGWFGQIKAVATGGVTFYNEERNTSGSADHAVYTQTPGQDDGQVLLTGSAHVNQNGNLLDAPELKVELSDNSAQTQGGRSTLIISPR